MLALAKLIKTTSYRIFTTVAVVAALAGWTECGSDSNQMPIGPITPGSPVTVTPDVNPLPYTSLQAPSPTMPVVAADVEALALELLNAQNSKIVFANLHTFAPQTDGGKVYVGGMGWYEYTQATPFTADGIWVVTADVGGQFIHEVIALHNLKRLPAIGPVPGESFSAVTPSGRINKDCIDHGYRIHDLDSSHHQYTTTSATAITLATLTDLGTLAVGDIVNFAANVSARGNSAAAFAAGVFVEYSQNGGGAWTAATGSGGTQYGMTADNLDKAIAANFIKAVGSGGDFQIRLRAFSDGTHTLVVDVDSWMAWVVRP